MSRRTGDGPHGLLVVDKQPGLTSHDVVARVRRLAGTRRVGHAGTLDPAATGLLLLGLGRATRLLTHLVGADKEYLATIRLGVTTTTEDAEGEVTGRTDASTTTAAAVREGAAALTGALEQVPSSVSAIKVDGQRAYARVRAGEDVVLAARPVVVSAFEVLAVRAGSDPQASAGVAGAPGAVVDVDARVVCSSGTYVRALARDLGLALGVGGHLTALRRTRVGPFSLAAATSLQELAEVGVPARLLSLADAARAVFPVWDVDAEAALRLAHGQRLPAGSLPSSGARPEASLVAAVAPGDVLVALVAERDGAVRPELVLASPADVSA